MKASATVLSFEHSPAARIARLSRDEIVHEMAMHLIAGASASLDLASDFDVIRYLKNTPEGYRARLITAHMDDAVQVARQAIFASVFGGG